MRAQLPTNSVVVSASELSKIRQRAVVRSVADEARERQERQAEFEKKKVQARMRKEKMMQMEAASKRTAKKSDVELAKITREKTIREYANKLVDENLDLVKMLNTIGSRAAAFTIRDAQLEEKAGRGGEERVRLYSIIPSCSLLFAPLLHLSVTMPLLASMKADCAIMVEFVCMFDRYIFLESLKFTPAPSIIANAFCDIGYRQLYQDYNKKMELEMEIARLKDLSERERIEEDKRSKRIADREVIIGQIQYRAKLKMLAEEQRERENQQMLKQIAKYEEEDRQKAAQHRIEVEKSKIEIMEANEEAIERKKAARAAEIAEVEALRIYQAKRDAEMARREKEEEDIANEKREQQKKLLAQQEKVQSSQAGVDELRARRYAEERERRARNEERAKAQKKKSQMLELMESRKSQAEAKVSMMAREAVMQQQEYEDGLKYSMKIMKREAAEESTKKAKADEHRVKLQQQIDEREIARKKSQSKKFEEGRSIHEEFATERAKLEAIRDCMVEDMLKKGINPKYLSEMKMCDIEKMQMR